eukprot:Tamp_14112.p1 GENE.Tamp_14112~~Tamp_14112.p1  ORF type:complete len:445 (+),score=80.08 Tamp_14112:323-1657(+)
MRRPGEPCFMGAVSLSGTNQQVPALCVANGRRDAGAHVTGTLTAWDRVTSDQADAIAVVHFTNEASAVGQVSACIASGAKACILVHESAPLQRFAGKDLEALSVPVAIVNVAMPVGECATLKVDAKGTWTFPSLPAPYKFELRGVELGFDRQVVGKVRRNEPATWTEEHGWDVDEEGMIGLPPVWNKRAMENRQSDKLYRAACSLLGHSETIVSIDRFAFFRPTLLPERSDEWVTANNIHLDMDPWRFYGIPTAACSGPSEDEAKGDTPYDWEGDFMKEHNITPFGAAKNGAIQRIQGLFNFLDNKTEDGGFQVVPGAHKTLEAWAVATKDSPLAQSAEPDFNLLDWNHNGVQEQKDPTCMCDDRQHITLRAGSVIFWDYKLPHGSAPNKSKHPRIAQFFKVIPAANFSRKSVENRARVTRPIVDASGCTVTETGAKFLALKPW